MKGGRIEPGLLTIFRLFLLFQLLLILVNLHIHSARGLLPGNGGGEMVLSVACVLALIAYLSWRGLRERMGRLFLPLALVFSALFSVAAHHFFLTLPMAAHGGSSEEATWQIFLFLFVPVVLASWQYGFSFVVGYCLFAILADYSLMRWTDPAFSGVAHTYHRLLLIRFVSFLAIGYVVSRIMGQLRRERKALQSAKQELENSVATLEQLTVSRERVRVARELHDTLAHTLSGLAVQLEAVSSLWSGNREKAREMLQHSLEVTRDGLTETRRAIQSLRATPLEDLGLAQAIRQFSETAADRGGFRLDLDLPKEIDGLPPEVEQCFYRIGMEAVENASRHARPAS